jgi:hypothetical protein
MYQPKERPGRTFEVRLTSDVTGYAVRVWEHIDIGVKQSVDFRLMRLSIDPGTFYKERSHHRRILVGDVLEVLKSGHVVRLTSDSSEHEISKSDAFLRANLIGWEKGYPEVTEDNLDDWNDFLSSLG